MPKLLKCHDLCKGLAVVCNPKEELDVAYFLDRVDYDRNDIDCDHENKEIVYEPGIKLLIAEGNEHPMHPDWLRSLRGQCKDANVPFHFAGWGDWVPLRDIDGIKFEEENRYVLRISSDGTIGDDRHPDIVWMANTKMQSGRLLDGVEHNGRVS